MTSACPVNFHFLSVFGSTSVSGSNTLRADAYFSKTEQKVSVFKNLQIRVDGAEEVIASFNQSHNALRYKTDPVLTPLSVNWRVGRLRVVQASVSKRG